MFHRLDCLNKKHLFLRVLEAGNLRSICQLIKFLVKSPLSGFASGHLLAASSLDDSSYGKESACNAGDLGSERSPGEGNGSLFQYYSLENTTDRGAWQATVHGLEKESDTTE